jgi:hypothetical protein
MTKEPKIGRPPKPAPKGKRVSLGLKVTADVKRLIDSQAKKTGSSQSQVAEQLIQRALQYDRTLKAMGTTLSEIEQQSEDAVRHRAGLTKVRGLSADGIPTSEWRVPVPTLDDIRAVIREEIAAALAGGGSK